MPEQPFRCKICGFTTADEALATDCEQQGTPDFTFEVGEQVVERPSGQSFWIVDRHVARVTPKKGINHPQHMARYTLSTDKTGGRRHWKNQQDLRKK